MQDYPLTDVRDYIAKGFKEGFSLEYVGPRRAREAGNLASTKQAPEILQGKIKKELEAGRIAGPFAYPPLPTLQVSPVGLIPKKDGDYRVIHHLSYPDHNSINDFIPPELCSVSYASIDDAAEMIHNLGQGALLAKSDIKSAFRLLPISPCDFDLLGIKFDGHYYFDKCLPMGASISCAMFEKFATFINWLVVNKTGNKNILHYLDDFLFGGQSGNNQCQASLDIFENISHEIGLPLSQEKTVGPTTCLCFLGVEFDTVELVMRLPRDKIVQLCKELGYLLTVNKVTLCKLQSVLGMLNFACRVVAPGRAFCRRLIDTIAGVDKPHHKIRVSASMKADIKVWLSFLENYNCMTVIPDRHWSTSASMELYTDSAGGQEKGFGVYFQGSWAYGSWPTAWSNKGLLKDITFLELFPIYVSICLWGSKMRNQKVLFHCDNAAVVTIINKKSSKSQSVMTIIRPLVLLTLNYNLNIRAEHIPGKYNVIADSISRQQWARFRRSAPAAELLSTPIPAHLWEI